MTLWSRVHPIDMSLVLPLPCNLHISLGAQVLIGWSEDGEYIINPKDKLVPRPWSSEDRFVVIKDV